MVTRLPEPNVDEIAYLDSVVQERQNGKHAEFFEGIREEWKARASLFRNVSITFTVCHDYASINVQHLSYSLHLRASCSRGCSLPRVLLSHQLLGETVVPTKMSMRFPPMPMCCSDGGTSVCQIDILFWSSME
jgi:hypothetical protein